MIDTAMTGVTLPVYTESIYGSALSLGLITGVIGGAAVIGALLYGWVGTRFSRRWLFTLAFAFANLRMVVFLLFPSLWILLLIISITSLAIGPLNPILMAVLYQRIPKHMRARVFGFLSAGVLIATPLGALIAGYLLEWIGLTWSLIAYTLIYLGAVILLISNPRMAEMDSDVTSSEAEETEPVSSSELAA